MFAAVRHSQAPGQPRQPVPVLPIAVQPASAVSGRTACCELYAESAAQQQPTAHAPCGGGYKR